MALLGTSSPNRGINSRRISGLGLVIDKPRTPKLGPSPLYHSRTVYAADGAPPLVPLVSVTDADYGEASPKYEEVDSSPWGRRQQQQRRSPDPADPHQTPKARPSSTLSTGSSTSTAWLFGDDEAHSPLVLSEKPLELLNFYPSRRASTLGVSNSAKLRHGFATPLGFGTDEDVRLTGADSTGLPTYAAAMTPPTLIAPRWLDNPNPIPSTSQNRLTPTPESVGCETFSGWVVDKACDLKASLTGKRYSAFALACVWALSLLIVVAIIRREHLWNFRRDARDGQHHQFEAADLLRDAHPTTTLADNLRPGVRYLIGGRGNDPTPSLTDYFLSSYKLIYLGKLLHRVTIVPGLPEGANHVPLPFSDVFDIDAFHSSTSHLIPLVELSAVKLPTAPNGHLSTASSGQHYGSQESLGCWSSHHLLTGHALPPADPTSQPSEALASYGLSLQPWLLPEKSIARAAGGYDVLFESVVAFDWERERKNSWITRLLSEAKSSSSGMSRETLSILASLRRDNKPTEQLFCLDDTLHLGHAQFEPPVPHRHGTYRSPSQRLAGDDQAWQTVGQHLRFQRHLVTKADNALKELLNAGQTSITASQARFPRFIAVHAKAGVSMQRYASAVARIGSVLGVKKLSGRSLSRIPTLVFFQGDVTRAVREDIRTRGWILASEAVKMDRHSGGSDVMADLLQQAMMTRSVGFVGTGRDATSELTALRCKSWHNLPTTTA